MLWVVDGFCFNVFFHFVCSVAFCAVKGKHVGWSVAVSWPTASLATLRSDRSLRDHV